VLSFVMEGAHPHDIGTILDKQGWLSGPATIARNR
jgi:selenocysteine lyase/cysteine desulfurase